MDGAAAGHDAGDAVCRQRDVPQQHARMDGEVVHALAHAELLHTLLREAAGLTISVCALRFKSLTPCTCSSTLDSLSCFAPPCPLEQGSNAQQLICTHTLHL